MRWTIAICICLLPTMALAQTVDQCKQEAGPTVPGAKLTQQLRCTIQILDAQRMEAMDRATASEVRAQMAEGEIQRLEAKLAKEKAPPTKPKEAPKPRTETKPSPLTTILRGMSSWLY